MPPIYFGSGSASVPRSSNASGPMTRDESKYEPIRSATNSLDEEHDPNPRNTAKRNCLKQTYDCAKRRLKHAVERRRARAQKYAANDRCSSEAQSFLLQSADNHRLEPAGILRPTDPTPVLYSCHHYPKKYVRGVRLVSLDDCPACQRFYAMTSPGSDIDGRQPSCSGGTQPDYESSFPPLPSQHANQRDGADTPPVEPIDIPRHTNSRSAHIQEGFDDTTRSADAVGTDDTQAPAVTSMPACNHSTLVSGCDICSPLLRSTLYDPNSSRRQQILSDETQPDTESSALPLSRQPAPQMDGARSGGDNKVGERGGGLRKDFCKPLGGYFKRKIIEPIRRQCRRLKDRLKNGFIEDKETTDSEMALPHIRDRVIKNTSEDSWSKKPLVETRRYPNPGKRQRVDSHYPPKYGPSNPKAYKDPVPHPNKKRGNSITKVTPTQAHEFQARPFTYFPPSPPLEMTKAKSTTTALPSGSSYPPNALWCLPQYAKLSEEPFFRRFYERGEAPARCRARPEPESMIRHRGPSSGIGHPPAFGDASCECKSCMCGISCACKPCMCASCECGPCMCEPCGCSAGSVRSKGVKGREEGGEEKKAFVQENTTPTLAGYEDIAFEAILPAFQEKARPTPAGYENLAFKAILPAFQLMAQAFPKDGYHDSKFPEAHGRNCGKSSYFEKKPRCFSENDDRLKHGDLRGQVMRASLSWSRHYDRLLSKFVPGSSGDEVIDKKRKHSF